MSLVTKMVAGFSRLANISEAIRVSVGNLSNLTTTEKSNLVASINELVTQVANASNIDDDVTNTNKTWSSSKINTEITSAVASLINGAGTDSDTLKELADKITALVSADNGLVSAMSSQTFTEAQKATARGNIGAISEAEIGNTATDFVAVIDGIYGA